MEDQDIYIQKIDQILKKHLTEKSFDLWIAIRENISNKCWEKATSSSGKYHRKEDQGGRIPSCGEHTFEMLFVCEKIIPMFEGNLNTDVIFLAVALHDAYKYGLIKTCNFVESRHDQIIADIIKNNKKTFLQALNESDISILEEGVRFHMGRWSTNADKNFSYSNYSPLVLFLSTLDMLSSKNALKIF